MAITTAQQDAFRQSLLAWFDVHRRPLPWRETQDPYRVWVSEIMLQQTRVGQAAPYFDRFMDAFPTVHALAGAGLDDVLRLWEGLGYYARARHLHAAAKIVVEQHDGAVPSTPEGLRALPGIGAYTAGAIASIAFGLPQPAVDGNIRRVLARYFQLASPTPNELEHRAGQLIDPVRPGDFNQALMELGSQVCTPRNPRCSDCPLRRDCAALACGAPTDYPARKPKRQTPHFDVAVGVVFDAQGRLLIQRRPEEGLLGGLWELPGGKRRNGESLQETCQRELCEELGITVSVGDLIGTVRHAYSHFRITLHAFRCSIATGTPRSTAGLPVRWVAVGDLGAYAFPRANRRILDRIAQAAPTQMAS